ncbi:palmitoyltransferase akr1 [Friedmanniomyces endolithicus]|nr:palmitoyltransferase akr1 [Friedmanniomyces endolithicus]KAK0788551.1 palmitoyltransferase akr1 [Friedmanniomyces endolithicus]KAK0802709.1 palmitoyltransferase akr1 [Friedmanniomyces endolithicus]KAK0808544.1 palmitoyltransferase akr1 [Friedmanniomyces endolithicus]KAK0856633.1 palmitoyltransferase akr1 [Friedmanniomyces endolithicus]
MASRDPSATPDQRKISSSQSSSEGKDGLDKVELSDLDASPPRLPVEQDLMQLARLGELRSIQRLFDSGTYNAKSTDEQGITALHWAAINGHHALCHFLIQSGADVNARGGDAQATPVLWASKRCHLQVVSLLLANGADPLLKDDQGYNLLHSATLDGNIYQLVLLLHQPNLSVDVSDSQGHTSLMWAAYKGFGACVDILLRWGADVHAVDEMGFTALHWALVKGNYVCIQKLVEYGSDRFARSKPTEGQTEGDTPAATAAKMKSERQWRKALLDTGFDEAGNPMAMPIPFAKDKRTFYKRTFFFWPFALGGLQLWMLATLPVWFGVPGVLIVGYALQLIVQKSLRWAPSDMKTMHKTPFLAGIFAGTLFWVGVRYIFDVLPWTFTTHPFLNLSFAVSYILCTYFYTLTMTADPGYVPKGNSRGQTKKVIDELIEHNAFDEAHFCTSCMIRKPLRNIEILPEPTEFHCSILKDALCAQFSKDPLTIITNAWGSLQLTWTFMLLFVHLSQIARNITTYETMRGQVHAGPLMTAVATGTISAEGAQVDGQEATTDANHEDGSAGPLHGHGHKRKAKEGCLTQWSRLLGIDTFVTIAFQGYKGSQSQAERKRQKKRNLWTRGMVRNCQDFWLDGPVMKRRAESTKALLGGEEVDYAFVYDVPKRSGMSYRGGYESVATEECEV